MFINIYVLCHNLNIITIFAICMFFTCTCVHVTCIFLPLSPAATHTPLGRSSFTEGRRPSIVEMVNGGALAGKERERVTYVHVHVYSTMCTLYYT